MTSKDVWELSLDRVNKELEFGVWLNLRQDNDKIILVFLGDPYAYEIPREGREPKLEIAINVAIYNTGVVRVLSLSTKTFRTLCQVRDKYGLDNWAFEFTRHGVANNPDPTYTILVEKQLQEDKKKFAELKLYDLENVCSVTLGN
jgi:hypothetical protein